MNLKRPPIFLRISSTTQATYRIKPQNIEYIEDGFFHGDKVAVVTHRAGGDILSFMTNLTSQEIEQGMNDLVQQQEDYSDEYFNIKFLGDSDE